MNSIKFGLLVFLGSVVSTQGFAKTTLIHVAGSIEDRKDLNWDDDQIGAYKFLDVCKKLKNSNCHLYINLDAPLSRPGVRDEYPIKKSETAGLPSKDSILRKVKEALENAAPGDQVVFSLKAHGFMDPDNDSCAYINVKEKICTNDIDQILKEKKPGTQFLLVAESCFSGGLARFSSQEVCTFTSSDDFRVHRAELTRGKKMDRFWTMLNSLKKADKPLSLSDVRDSYLHLYPLIEGGGFGSERLRLQVCRKNEPVHKEGKKIREEILKKIFLLADSLLLRNSREAAFLKGIVAKELEGKCSSAVNQFPEVKGLIPLIAELDTESISPDFLKEFDHFYEQYCVQFNMIGSELCKNSDKIRFIVSENFGKREKLKEIFQDLLVEYQNTQGSGDKISKLNIEANTLAEMFRKTIQDQEKSRSQDLRTLLGLISKDLCVDEGIRLPLSEQELVLEGENQKLNKRYQARLPIQADQTRVEAAKRCEDSFVF